MGQIPRSTERNVVIIIINIIMIYAKFDENWSCNLDW